MLKLLVLDLFTRFCFSSLSPLACLGWIGWRFPSVVSSSLTFITLRTEVKLSVNHYSILVCLGWSLNPYRSGGGGGTLRWDRIQLYSCLRIQVAYSPTQNQNQIRQAWIWRCSYAAHLSRGGGGVLHTAALVAFWRRCSVRVEPGTAARGPSRSGSVVGPWVSEGNLCGLDWWIWDGGGDLWSAAEFLFLKSWRTSFWPDSPAGLNSLVRRNFSSDIKFRANTDLASFMGINVAVYQIFWTFRSGVCPPPSDPWCLLEQKWSHVSLK